MLKLLSSSRNLHAHIASPCLRATPAPSSGGASGSSSPLLRALNSIAELSRGSSSRHPNFFRRAFFCSDSSSSGGDGTGRGVLVEVALKGDDSDADAGDSSNSSSAIVPTNPRPEDYLTVLALPLPHRPLFPGFYMPINVKDPKLMAALQEARKRQAPYAGAFLLKEEPGSDPNVVSGSESEKSPDSLKGKDLYNRLHEVGTLAQISTIQGEQVVLIGHRRLRITEMVSEEPLTVKVDHIKDKPYNKDDDVVKATSFEVISTLRDVLKSSSLWRDHVQTYTQHIGDFNYSRLADFGAAISGANKLQCQEVLEELDVHNRLRLTLELVKKEMEITKIQVFDNRLTVWGRC
ncbi:unnamed protein product [Linum tenue]|uniref:Lon N-terminal domain-containing protein n=1 Tax=Linum tenue TaxID=586396 RepID=A0AAV0NM26_9ROSI|nr:unnamed protein product [Linum tenue]